MPDKTTKRKWPYPLPGEPVRDGALRIRELAEAIEKDLEGGPGPTGNRALVSVPLPAGYNGSGSTLKVWRRGDIVTIAASIVNGTGSAKGTTAIDIASLPTDCLPPEVLYGVAIASNTNPFRWSLGLTGHLLIRANPTADWPAGQGLILTTSYGVA